MLSKSRYGINFCLLAFWVFAPWNPVNAQVIIFPPPHPPGPVPPRPIPVIPRPIEYRELTIDAATRDQAGQVEITQIVANPGEVPVEAEYLFPLPEDAAVGQLVFLVDGKEIPGKLHSKEEARKIYEEIVRRQRDPALLEYAGRGMFRASIFPIPGHAERKLTLRYTQLLKKDQATIGWRLPIGGGGETNRPQKANLHIRLETSEDLKAIYSPTHKIEFKRDGQRSARGDASLITADELRDVQIYFSVAERPIAASILSWQPREGEDGYFLLLASPGLGESKATPQAKTVIFVLDRSGSMAGTKLDQARDALTYVIKQLQPGDTFNILVYDDRVESYRPELQGLDESARAAALKYIDDIRPGGSTNIDEALRTALGMITDSARPAYILFLTDGLPTAGETAELIIAKHAREENKHNARLLVWGVGDDVNARLLDRLGSENGGASDYVRPNENIEAGVSRVFARMANPVLTSPTLTLDGPPWNRLYPRALPDLFAGEQMVVLGRYPKEGNGILHLRGQGAGKPQEFTYPVKLDGPTSGTGQEFIARLWATRRIADLLDQIDLNGQNKELTDELVALSKVFGIITPYTSFLAQEDVSLANAPLLQERASMRLSSLGQVSGAMGAGQRAYKQQLSRGDAATLSPASAPAKAISAEMDALEAKAMPQRSPQSADTRTPAESVHRIGSKSFYWKQGRWQDAALTLEQMEKPVEITQFSEDWFALSRRLGPDENAYLTMREPAILLMEGKVYLIKQALP